MEALDKYSGYTHWLVRLSLAGIFLFHGITKFPMAQGMAEMMGMPVIMVYMLAMMETVGGVLILWGGFGPDWATRVAGAIFAVVMIGAVMMVHWPQWSFVASESKPMGGMEMQLFLLVSSLYLLTHGNRVNE